MRKIIPQNYVKFDYIGILNSFISLLHDRQGDNIECVYLSGSYARGEATDWSDLDVFCIFHTLTPDVLNDVGFAVRNTPVSYDELEINAQCMSSNEVNTGDFAGWTEKSARILDSVLLFGDDIFGENVSKTELRDIYKKYLVDILMGIRHYLSVDEPVEKLTYRKMHTYIFKPLMYPLRMERYCACGIFPLTISELSNLLPDDEKFVVEFFTDETVFDQAMRENHKKVLSSLHDLVCGKL